MALDSIHNGFISKYRIQEDSGSTFSILSIS